MEGEPVYLRLIHDQAYPGAHQMTVDESLFRNQIQTQDPNAIIRFYHFSEPTLTVGYGVWSKIHQNLTDEIPAVRRITGGGIVSHKTSDLTYAFIAPYTPFLSLRKTRGSYLFIHEVLKRALVDFGVRTSFFEDCCNGRESVSAKQRSHYCFEAPVLYDVMLGPNKVAGAGQKRTVGYLLHQGSIAWDLLLDIEPKLVETDFCAAFAKHLAEMLNLSVKEISLYAEEMVITQALTRHCEARPMEAEAISESGIASLPSVARNDG